MYSKFETIQIMHQHNMRLQDFKDFVATIGNKASYSEKELKNFLGY